MRIIYGVDLSYRYGVYRHPEKEEYYILDHKKDKIVGTHDSFEAADNHCNWKNEAEASAWSKGLGKNALGVAIGSLASHSVGYGVGKGFDKLGRMYGAWKAKRQGSKTK